MRDLDVRLAVRSRLRREHQDDMDTRVVEEMGIWNGAVRVDLAVINGEFVGYEIKSARDTLARLPNQASLYNAVFDRVNLVAAEKHLDHAIGEMPEWWGMISARSDGGGVRLEVLRLAGTNPAIEPLQLARLLWRDEALAILDRCDAARGVRSGTREKIAARLAETLSLDELRRQVRQCLKVRGSWLREPVSNQRHVTVGSEA
ncbi:sce7726 family protein [Sphingobium cupriresistens]|uniref:sce7726 family protein n=1 Tax=Sphingobium cupriresistens TaxID=1132417 RepID=UPI003BADF378